MSEPFLGNETAGGKQFGDSIPRDDDSRRLDPRKSRNHFGKIGIDEILVIIRVSHLSCRGHECVGKLVVLMVDSVWQGRDNFALRMAGFALPEKNVALAPNAMTTHRSGEGQCFPIRAAICLIAIGS